MNTDGAWTECDYNNGYLGDDGYTWSNLKALAAPGNAGQGASLLQQQAAVQQQVGTTVRPGASLIRNSRSLTRTAGDIAPQGNTVLDTNGQPTQLNGGADDFQWASK